MAYSSSQPVKMTCEAAAVLSALQFTFVKLDSSGNAAAAAAATDIPCGVLQNKPTTGQAAEIVVVGITKVEAGTTLTAGDLIGTAADGQAVALVAGVDTTAYVVGTMKESAGGAGVISTAIVNCSNPHRAA